MEEKVKKIQFMFIALLLVSPGASSQGQTDEFFVGSNKFIVLSFQESEWQKKGWLTLPISTASFSEEIKDEGHHPYQSSDYTVYFKDSAQIVRLGIALNSEHFRLQGPEASRLLDYLGVQPEVAFESIRVTAFIFADKNHQAILVSEGDDVRLMVDEYKAGQMGEIGTMGKRAEAKIRNGILDINFVPEIMQNLDSDSQMSEGLNIQERGINGNYKRSCVRKAYSVRTSGTRSNLKFPHL
jgi:hypothetical protein